MDAIQFIINFHNIVLSVPPRYTCLCLDRLLRSISSSGTESTFWCLGQGSVSRRGFYSSTQLCGLGGPCIYASMRHVCILVRPELRINIHSFVFCPAAFVRPASAYPYDTHMKLFKLCKLTSCSLGKTNTIIQKTRRFVGMVYTLTVSHRPTACCPAVGAIGGWHTCSARVCCGIAIHSGIWFCNCILCDCASAAAGAWMDGWRWQK